MDQQLNDNCTTLIRIKNNSSMNLTGTPIRSSCQSCFISEEPYCIPWDLKIQEEKFKLLNKQHQISSSFNHSNINKSFHRTYSTHKPSVNNSVVHRELSPPVPPPFPRGGLIPSCQCNTNSSTNRYIQRIDSSDTQHLNSSLPKTSTAYEQPWNISQSSVMNNLHRRSLQKIPLVSLYRYSNNTTTIPIDRYFWYHYAMSRRQAENVLESRSSGSFLVRQSESGNQNDYSLSIKTTNGCMHMRICYSNGFYILGECSRPFSSISFMIKYFSETPVPIRGAAHIKLGTPVLRWEIFSSSSLSNKELL